MNNCTTELPKDVINQDLLKNFNEISAKYHKILTLIANKTEGVEATTPILNNEQNQDLFKEILEQISKDPEFLMESNQSLMNKYNALMTNVMARFWGENATPIYQPLGRDRRFKDQAWQQNLYFDFLKQSYFMISEWVEENIAKLNIDKQTRRYCDFFSKQFLDALSPTNFMFYNPQVLRETMHTNGENIVKGLDNFLEDLEKSSHSFNIKTTDESQFKLGTNIATTPGKVIYRNELMELICYEPKEQTHTIPILLVPAWINKFYVFDLSPENSFVKYLIDNNFQVFVISWINPDSSLGHKNFEDYIQQGLINAIEYICNNLGYNQINALGYCLGGTLLSCGAAYLKAKNKKYLNSVSFLTTLLDFSEPGDLGLFLGENNLENIKQITTNQGVLSAQQMSATFSALKANDMIWSFFVNNYLMGRKPLPFDLLYWNSDSTNLPARMHQFYLENMYHKNVLTQPGALKLNNTPIDLNSINLPSFFLATREDHIVPWQSSYNSKNLFSGPIEFCLAASGHVAGVINPPSKNKYNFWTGPKDYSLSPDEWLLYATKQDGSWWNHWLNWQQKFAGQLAPSINYHKIPSLCPAPGEYVKVRY